MRNSAHGPRLHRDWEGTSNETRGPCFASGPHSFACRHWGWQNPDISQDVVWLSSRSRSRRPFAIWSPSGSRNCCDLYLDRKDRKGRMWCVYSSWCAVVGSSHLSQIWTSFDILPSIANMDISTIRWKIIYLPWMFPVQNFSTLLMYFHPGTMVGIPPCIGQCGISCGRWVVR